MAAAPAQRGWAGADQDMDILALEADQFGMDAGLPDVL